MYYPNGLCTYSNHDFFLVNGYLLTVIYLERALFNFPFRGPKYFDVETCMLFSYIVTLLLSSCTLFLEGLNKINLKLET